MAAGERRAAVVTGAARGLGRVTALLLAEAGFDVLVTYRSSEAEAQALRAELEARGARAVALRASSGSWQDAERVAEAMRRTFGRCDVLVQNAGPFLPERRPATETRPDEWEGVLGANLSGPFQLLRACLPLMQARRWGRVIHFGFAHAAEAPGWPGRGAYAAAKVGLVSLTRTLAVELAPFGITVNMICPGDIRHPYKEARIAEARKARDPRTPLGRPGTGEDVARVVRFLCEEDSDFLTGNVLYVTGGLDPLGPR